MSWLYHPLLPASAEIESSVPLDTTPDQFTFTDQTNVTTNTVITSNSFVVTGINADTVISVTGGSYNINGGAYQTAPSTVAGGETITVRHTSSSSYSTATNTTLTIGEVSDTFTSTTGAAPAVALSTAYWVGGAGTWTANSTSNWAATSGGPGGAGFTDATSTVYFDSNSGTGTVTINGGICNNFNIQSGVSALTLAPTTSGLTIYGNTTIASTNATISGSAAIVFAATASKTITTGGEALNCPINFDGAGGAWQLQDNLTLGPGRVATLTRGTIDLNSKTLICGPFVSSNSNVRSILGPGTINFSPASTTGIIWATSDSTNFSTNGLVNAITSITSFGLDVSITPGNLSESNAISFTLSVTDPSSVLSIPNGYAVKDLTISSNIGLSPGNNLTVYGNLAYTASPSSMQGTVVLGSTSGTKTITSNGFSTTSPLNFNGVGGTWQLVDNLTMVSTGSITLSNGTIDLNGKILNVGTRLTTAAGTKNITFNGGTLLCPSANTSSFNNAVPTGFTTTAGTGVGKISMSAATAKTFVGGSSVYNCTLENAGAGALTIQGNNTFADITNSVSPATFTFAAGSFNVFVDFNISGTVGNIVTINSSTPGTQASLAKGSGIVSVSYCSISDSNAGGGAEWRAYTTNGNVQGTNNTGWIFTGNTLSSGSILLIF